MTMVGCAGGARRGCAGAASRRVDAAPLRCGTPRPPRGDAVAVPLYQLGDAAGQVGAAQEEAVEQEDVAQRVGEDDDVWRDRVVRHLRCGIESLAQTAAAESPAGHPTGHSAGHLTESVSVTGAGTLPVRGRRLYLGGWDLGIGRGRSPRTVGNIVAANSVITQCGSCPTLVRATMVRRSAARAWRNGGDGGDGGSSVDPSDGCPRCGTAKKLRVRRIVNAQIGIIDGVLNGDLMLVERPAALGQTLVRPLGAPHAARVLGSAMDAALALCARVRTR